MDNIAIERKFSDEFESQIGSQHLKLGNNDSEWRKSLAKDFFVRGVLFAKDDYVKVLTFVKQEREELKYENEKLRAVLRDLEAVMDNHGQI